MVALLIALGVLGLVHVLTMAALGAALRVPPREIALGVGPPLWRRGRVALRVLPLGGSVRFAEGDDDPFAGRAADKKAIIGVGACLTLMAVGALLGAPLAAALSAWPELVGGALSPRALGAPRVARALALMRERPWAGAGVLAMKVAALNLLPLPNLNGGDVVAAALAPVWPRAPRSPAWIAVGALAGLALGGAWLMAAVFALRGA